VVGRVDHDGRGADARWVERGAKQRHLHVINHSPYSIVKQPATHSTLLLLRLLPAN